MWVRVHLHLITHARLRSAAVCCRAFWRSRGTNLTSVKRERCPSGVCLCILYTRVCVYVSVYLWEHQYSMALVFQFPQHLLQQHQFPRGLSEGRPFISTSGGFLSFLQRDKQNMALLYDVIILWFAALMIHEWKMMSCLNTNMTQKHFWLPPQGVTVL